MPWRTRISEGAPATFAEECTTQGQSILNLGESVVIKPGQGVRFLWGADPSQCITMTAESGGRCADAECLTAVKW